MLKSYIALACAVLLPVPWSLAQPVVTANGVTLQRYQVVEVILAEVQVFNCGVDQPIFHPTDQNEDGITELGNCIGIKYDPCNISGYQRQLVITAMTGGCRSQNELNEAARRQGQCDDGFSPRPPFCND